MSPAQYLIDTSALVRILTTTALLETWRQKVRAGLVAVCPIIALEFLYSARSMTDRASLVRLLHDSYMWVPMPDRCYDRASEVQQFLTARGTHRSAGAVDLLIAATAEHHELTLVHYDRDFDCVAAATGQHMQWLAPQGSLEK